MPRERLLYRVAALIVLIALLHILATLFDWYWNICWLDIVLHFAGGLWVSLMVFWLLFHSGYLPSPSRFHFRHALLMLASVLLIAVLWEGFEWVVGAERVVRDYWLDTVSDIACGMAGGLAGYLYFTRSFIFRHA